MRRLIIFGVLLIILITGGALTTLFLSGEFSSNIPVLTTTVDPDASVAIVQNWKAEQLFLFIGFVIFNLVGIALTLAIVFWLLDRSQQNTALRETGKAPNAGTTLAVKNADQIPAQTGSSRT